MKPFFSACIKLLGLYLGCWAIFTLFSIIPSLIFSFSLDVDVQTLALAAIGILSFGLRVALSFWLIFRTEWVLGWVHFSEVQALSFDARNILETGIIIIGLSILVNGLGDLVRYGSRMFIRGSFEGESNLFVFLAQLVTCLLAFGLIRFSHKVVALIERWQAASTEIE